MLHQFVKAHFSLDVFQSTLQQDTKYNVKKHMEQII